MGGAGVGLKNKCVYDVQVVDCLKKRSFDYVMCTGIFLLMEDIPMFRKVKDRPTNKSQLRNGNKSFCNIL